MATNNNFVHPEKCGVTVVGSATVKLSPDSAAIVAAVSRSEAEAKDALAQARASADQVQAFLKERGIRNFSASRITLTQDFRITKKEEAMAAGYKARIGFNIKLTDLDHIDEIVTGIIAAGANELLAINYQSSLMNEYRNDARRQAIAAAREKAELFCQELSVSLGRVLAMNEIINVPTKNPPLPGIPNLSDPTELAVASNVEVTYEIERDNS